MAEITRGGRKLEAAIERFGLGARIRGARVVDVGASTGGFTAALLRHGALHVTAVDVGHGQLDPSLRADRRVLCLEKTDWKKLALSVAPGPFDFFTVDVSFVAARSMMRGLAFRLRPGAEGVVLVKPQFELAGGQVRGEKIADPAVRARALDRFREKAESLGFQLLAHADSPVAGGEGTIEILAHLGFAGRSARLPAPGEKRPTKVTPSRRPQPGKEPSWFAVAAPGLEEVVSAEVKRLAGVADVHSTEGGVEFKGSIEVGMRANLELRVASRVLLRLGQMDAREFAKLRRQLGKLPWEAFVPRDRPLRVSASASRCRLYHTGALAETVALAVTDAIGKTELAGPAKPDGEGDPDATRIFIRGVKDRWTVSIDASGELLHRRGWRVETGRAPLRETLAAGILALAGYDSARPFVDPMCGAGTIALEACAIALGRPPGMSRSFAFERWPSFDPAQWQRLRTEAVARARPALAAPVFAFDEDEEAVEITRRNADRAGLAAHMTIDRVSFGSRPAPAAETGLVVLNPPYGKRIPLAGGGGRSGTQLPKIARILVQQYAGWRAGILMPAGPRWTAPGGRKPSALHRLQNGGLRVELGILDLSR